MLVVNVLIAPVSMAVNIGGSLTKLKQTRIIPDDNLRVRHSGGELPNSIDEIGRSRMFFSKTIKFRVLGVRATDFRQSGSFYQ